MTFAPAKRRIVRHFAGELAVLRLGCSTTRMKLSPAERMNLMRFVTSFVWTDLKVTQSERDFVMRVAGRMNLTEAEYRKVAAWLQVPPAADEIDPAAVPREHRQLFLAAAEVAVKADGRVVPAERDALAVFREMLDA